MRFGAALALAALAAGCSSVPVTESYLGFDGDLKKVFLAYYPEMTPSQRLSFLEAQYDPVMMLYNWKLRSTFHKERPEEPPEFIAEPKNYRILRLEIETDYALPVEKGDSLPMKAIARYADGRNADATAEATWSVSPESVSLNGSMITFGCLHSDVVVTANFLGEQGGSRSIPIRKALKELEVRVAGRSIASSEGEYVTLEAIAHCKDGSRTDVSCQADWNSPKRPGAINGCGHFHLGQDVSDDLVLEVELSYGGLRTVRSLTVPARRRPPIGIRSPAM